MLFKHRHWCSRLARSLSVQVSLLEQHFSEEKPFDLICCSEMVNYMNCKCLDADRLWQMLSNGKSCTEAVLGN